jgi:hypothetical protein
MPFFRIKLYRFLNAERWLLITRRRPPRSACVEGWLFARIKRPCTAFIACHRPDDSIYRFVDLYNYAQPASNHPSIHSISAALFPSTSGAIGACRHRSEYDNSTFNFISSTSVGYLAKKKSITTNRVNSRLREIEQDKTYT